MKALAEQKIYTNSKKKNNLFSLITKEEKTLSYYEPSFDSIKISMNLKEKNLTKVNTRCQEIKAKIKEILGLVDIYTYTDKFSNNKTSLSLELSSKLLKENYFDGITNKTYSGVKAFIKNLVGDIVSVRDSNIIAIAGDVKLDYKCTNSANVIKELQAVTNYDSTQFTAAHYCTNTLRYQNKLATKTLRYTYCIYNKTKELRKSRNRHLVEILKKNMRFPNQEIVRFELKLKYPQQINNHLYGTGAYDNKRHTLKELLTPKIGIRHPIKKVFKEIFPDLSSDSTYTSNSWKPLMKAVGPMKFAQGLGMVSLGIIFQNSRLKIQKLIQDTYSPKSCLSKERKNLWFKTLIANNSVKPETSRALEDLLIPRVKRFFDDKQVTIDNTLKLVEEEIDKLDN